MAAGSNGSTIDVILRILDQSGPGIEQVAARLAALEKQIEGLGGQYEKTGEEGEKAHRQTSEGAKRHENSVVDLAKAYALAQGAIAAAREVAAKSWELLIQQNITLREQVQSTAAQIVSKQDVLSGGKVVADSLEAIKAAQGPIQEQITQLRQDATSLSSVTSNDLVPSFQAMVNASGSLRLNLSQSRELTVGLTAQATTLGLNAQQAQNYIQQIASGTIDPTYNLLAKSIGLNNERLRQLAAEGKLYDYIQQKTEAGLKGQELIAKSWNGVTSNIEEYVQLIGQAAGAPLLDVMLGQLTKVQDLLKANLEPLQAFGADLGAKLADVFQAFADAGQAIIEAIVPAFEGSKDAASDFLDLVVGGFKSLAGLIQAIAPAIGVAAQVVAGIFGILEARIEKARLQFANFVGFLSKIPGLDKFIGDPIKEAADSINSLNDATGALNNESLKTLDRINEAKKQGNNLTAQQAAENQRVAATARQQLGAIDEQLKLLKQYTPITEQQKQNWKDQIALLQGRRQAIQDSLKDLKGGNDNIKFQNKELEDKGAVFEQLEKKAKAYQQSLEKPLDLNQAQEAAKNLQDVTKQQFELGQITKQQAEERLAAIANDGRLEVATRQAAEKELGAIRDQAQKEDLNDLKIRQSEVQAAIDGQTLSEAEGAKRISAIKKEELEAQLKNAQEALDRESQQGRGKGQQASQLKAQIAQFEQELAKAARDERKRAYDQSLTDFDEQQKILEGKKSQGLVDEQAFANQSLAITQKRLDAELAEVQRQRRLLSATDKEGLEKLATQEADIQKRRVEAAEKFEQQKLALLERDQRKAIDAVKLSEVQRDTEIQRLLNNRQIRQSEVEELKLQASRKTIEAELKLEQEKTAALERLPKLSDPAKEAERQEKIRASRIKTAEQTKQLLENEYQLQQAHFKKIEEQLNRQAQATKNTIEGQTQVLQQQITLQDSLTKSLDSQNKLLEARKSLSQSLTGYLTGELDILAQTATSEGEKQRIAELTAAVKFRSLQQQQAIERQILELNLQQNKAALEKEKIQNRIAQLKNQADIAQAQADLAKTKAKPDATPEEIAAAELNLRAKQGEGLGLQLQGAMLEQQGKIQDEQAKIQRFQQQNQQALAQDQGRLSLIQSLPKGEQGEALKNLRSDLYTKVFGFDPSQDGSGLGQFQIDESLRSIGESTKLRGGVGNFVLPGGINPLVYEPKVEPSKDVARIQGQLNQAAKGGGRNPLDNLDAQKNSLIQLFEDAKSKGDKKKEAELFQKIIAVQKNELAEAEKQLKKPPAIAPSTVPGQKPGKDGTDANGLMQLGKTLETAIRDGFKGAIAAGVGQVTQHNTVHMGKDAKPAAGGNASQKLLNGLYDLGREMQRQQRANAT